MIEHVTLSVHSARAWTRIRAPLIDACEMTLTLGTQDALRSALRRYADVIGQAGTCGIAGYYLTQRVWTAGRRGARRWSFGRRDLAGN